MEKRQRAFLICCIVMLAVILLSAAAALCLGQYSIEPSRVLREIFGIESGINDNARTVIFNIRLPRIIMALAAGAGLSVSGAAFQSVFSNPLATPDTLGVSNGASFGAALGILLGAGAFTVQLSALGFGAGAVILVFFVSSRIISGRSSVLVMILSGLVISTLFSALVTLIKYVADPLDKLPVITFWLMGSFSGMTRKNLLLALPLIALGTVILILMRYRLNVLSLSDEEARSMGVNLKLSRALVIACAAMVTASVVSVCGVIGWVGLLMPHISRMLFGNDNRYVVPFSAVGGAFFMLVIDTAARCLSAAEIPVSILTALTGAPVFILILRKTGGIKL